MQKCYSLIVSVTCSFLLALPAAFSQSSQEQDLGYAVTVEVIRAQSATATTTTAETSPATTAISETSSTSAATALTTATSPEQTATTAQEETTATSAAESVETGFGDFTYVFGIAGAAVLGAIVYFMWSRGWNA